MLVAGSADRPSKKSVAALSLGGGEVEELEGSGGAGGGGEDGSGGDAKDGGKGFGEGGAGQVGEGVGGGGGETLFSVDGSWRELCVL